MARLAAILLPGIVMPPDLAYAGLIEALGPRVDARAKPLEVYATPSPPGDHSLQAEVDGLLAFADDAGFDRFHLLGYSGGGAVSVMAAADPGAAPRIRSLALIEPAWAGNEDQSPAERAARERVDAAAGAGDPSTVMRGFMLAQLAPGVEPPPPPPGPPPAWMSLRPAGIAAIVRAFAAARLDVEALRRFGPPTYLAYGGRSAPDLYPEIVHRLSGTFPHVTVERYDDRHHFDPPHRAEPERLAAALRAVWAGSTTG